MISGVSINLEEQNQDQNVQSTSTPIITVF